MYYDAIQGAEIYNASRRLRITVDLPTSKKIRRERGEKMRHGADGWWWAVCNEGVYKQPEPSVKEIKIKITPVGGRVLLFGRVGWWWWW